MVPWLLYTTDVKVASDDVNYPHCCERVTVLWDEIKRIVPILSIFADKFAGQCKRQATQEWGAWVPSGTKERMSEPVCI